MARAIIACPPELQIRSPVPCQRRPSSKVYRFAPQPANCKIASRICESGRDAGHAAKHLSGERHPRLSGEMRRASKFIAAERHLNFTGQAFARVIEIDHLEGRLEQQSAESALTWTEDSRTTPLLPAEFQD